MRAKDVKKLRNKVLSFKQFVVIVSGGAFGEFDMYYDKKSFNALNPQHAIEKYCKQWRRRNKERFKFKHYDLVEDTRGFGHFMVIDEKGYKTFWR